MGEWDGVTFSYIQQCTVCKMCNGKGCKAFNTEKRDPKYYDMKNDNFSKCSEFVMNEEAHDAELFLKLSKKYDWKKD